MKHSERKPDARERKIGKVVFLAEKLNAAGQLSSCCVGTEALLEADSQPLKVKREKTASKD